MNEPSTPDALQARAGMMPPTRRTMLQVAAAAVLAGAAGVLGARRADASGCTDGCYNWLGGCRRWCQAHDNQPSCFNACSRLYKECHNGGSNCIPPPSPDEYYDPTFIPVLMLLPGHEVIANTYKARLIMQYDGNLVVYDEYNRARWASHTVNNGAFSLFQQDGNLVVYNGSNSASWASNTCCWTDNYLSVQNDGNVVVYTWWGFPLWATGTNH